MHGTSFAAVASVLSTETGVSGLKPGGLAGTRRHVHCAQYPLKDIRLAAGITEVEIYIDIHRLLEDGHEGCMSSAGVLLFPDEIPGDQE